jgi:hypothetical protein
VVPVPLSRRRCLGVTGWNRRRSRAFGFGRRSRIGDRRLRGRRWPVGVLFLDRRRAFGRGTFVLYVSFGFAVTGGRVFRRGLFGGRRRRARDGCGRRRRGGRRDRCGLGCGGGWLSGRSSPGCSNASVPAGRPGGGAAHRARRAHCGVPAQPGGRVGSCGGAAGDRSGRDPRRRSAGTTRAASSPRRPGSDPGTLDGRLGDRRNRVVESTGPGLVGDQRDQSQADGRRRAAKGEGRAPQPHRQTSAGRVGAGNEPAQGLS